MKNGLVGSVDLCALLFWEGALLKFIGVIRAWGAVETRLLSDLVLI